MASSDDESDAVPHTVSDYSFVDDKDEPVPFSELPVQWNDFKGLDGKKKQIFLHGTTDNGLQKIYKQVTAWKFDISDATPHIWVFSKEGNWIKLQKPRKSFEDTIRTILITVQCLHSVKKNPELSGRSLWDNLSKVFSSYETRPSENDLIDHMDIIAEAVGKDETLAKSKFFVTLLEEKPQKKKAFDEEIGTTTKVGFIVDDDMIDDFEEDDDSDEEDELFDSVCAICDNGGDILCCEGRCMRSFHANKEAAGPDTPCESLGLSNEQVKAIPNFFCKNCQYKQHQCFACGELGSSDKLFNAEVFPCVSATCGRFYHPRCVAKLLHRESATEAEELQKKIAAGESFTCPIHKCVVCKQGENKKDPDLQFAVCRRCPKSYHKKCLPRKIAFEDREDEGIIQRAWKDLIPNRILIYCLKHEIDDDLGTPIRNHIKFPDDGEKKKKQLFEKFPKKREVLEKERTLDSADASRKRTVGKLHRGVDLSTITSEDGNLKNNVRRSTLPISSKKQKLGGTSIKPLNNNASTEVTKSTDESRSSLGLMLYKVFKKSSVGGKFREEDSSDGEQKQIPTDKPVAKEKSNSLPLDDASKQRILALVEDAGSSITLEKIRGEHKVPTIYAHSSKYLVEKGMTLGKVEGSVEAIREALQVLEKGGSIEDAKAVCEPEVLNNIIKWKHKLQVYLAPFLFGTRYTSFGRHFTKLDKLKEIVDLLHCYVQDGDMIVDFCCGSNDFSWLMKEKLDEIGTRCSYKNYDLLQAKNDFNFEKRDWMTVHPEELPTGSQLIMGLNPPFGKNAALANKFIDKALEFKPKLLILIIPPETQRLDKKDSPYDLVWEDNAMLSGKSFYLPGSVDVNDNQLEDWNSNTPLLWLWSRPDWTAKHKDIAQQHGHLSRIQEQSNLEAQHESLVSDKPVDVCEPDGQIPMLVDDHPVQNQVREHLGEREARVLESRKEGLPRDNGDREVHENSSRKNLPNEDSKKRRPDKEERLEKGKHGRAPSEKSPALEERRDKGKQAKAPSEKSPALEERRDKGKHGREPSEKPAALQERGQSPLSEMYDKLPRLSPPIVSRGRSSLDARLSESLESPLNPEFGHYPMRYMENRADDIARVYGREEPYPRSTHQWPSGASPSPGLDSMLRNSAERFPGYQRDTTDNRGHRSYISDFEQNYATQSVLRSQVRHYGQQHYPDPYSQRSGHLGGGDPGYPSPYSHLGPPVDASYNRMDTTTSAMQRYAPRLDELNHTRINPLASVPPHTAGRNGIPDPLARQPGYRGDSMSFAAGPYRTYPQQNNSLGWLND